MDSFVKLLVLDVEASSKFYRKLGFEAVDTDGTFHHLKWKEHGHLFLVGVPQGVNVEGRRGWGVLLSFTTADLTQVEQAATELSAPVQGPNVQPWNTRELVITDPDGYRLNFVAPLKGSVA